MLDMALLESLGRNFRKHSEKCRYIEFGACVPSCPFDPSLADTVEGAALEIHALRAALDAFAKACWIDSAGDVYEADFGDLRDAHRAYRDLEEKRK